MPPTKATPQTGQEAAGRLSVQGQVQLEELSTLPNDLKIVASVYDRKGQLMGQEPVDAEGHFRVNIRRLKSPFDGELVLGPSGDPKAGGPAVRGSALHRHQFTAEDFKGSVLQSSLYLPKYVWWPWWPRTICVTGHVRKVASTPSGTEICPVPFVKVEVYDVDRESCWWPPIYNWRDRLVDKLVVRAEDLIPIPIPDPDPGPLRFAGSRPPVPLPDPSPIAFFDRRSRFEQVGLNPQPLPPRELSLVALNPQPEPPSSDPFSASLNRAALVGFDPQPEPPGKEAFQSRANFFSGNLLNAADLNAEQSYLRLAPITRLPELQQRLDRLTITSKIPPWLIYPGCFYSRAEVCETTTDCDGYFECCFTWYPFHVRRGRFRFDPRPDILLKVTQTIGGVDTVIYLDPYTSTRWNVTNAHVDLYLDDPQVQCGSGCQPQPTGPVTFLTLIGLDEVYKINQSGGPSTGKFSNLPYGGGLSNWAYGGSLLICGLFGDALSTGAPMRYYRLSYSKGGGPFTPIQTPMSDTRVDSAFNSEIHALGPMVINGVPDLYEVRDTANYLWYNPDKLAWWNTEAIETASDLYTLRLEVFDENGVKLTSASVDYRDGTVAPPGPLPSLVDSCDMQILIDNEYPDLNLSIPAAGGDCGVVSCANRGSLAFGVYVNQPYGRLYYWNLWYVQGLGASSGGLGSAANGSGLATPVNLSIPAGPPFTTTAETCAYSLTLGAWPLVRNGFSAIHWVSQTKAIAVEGC